MREISIFPHSFLRLSEIFIIFARFYKKIASHIALQLEKLFNQTKIDTCLKTFRDFIS